MVTRKHWSKEEVRMLKKLASQNTPLLTIARKIGRTPDAIYSKAVAENIPMDRSTSKAPNGRRKKPLPR
jgi:hypothetical protein